MRIESLGLHRGLHPAGDPATRELDESADCTGHPMELDAAARQFQFRGPCIDVGMPAKPGRARIGEQTRPRVSQARGRTRVGEALLDLPVDLPRRFPDGRFPQREARGFAHLEPQHEHVGERDGPRDHEQQARQDDRCLDERRSVLVSATHRQCRSSARMAELASSPGTRLAAFDSVTGMSRAPQSGLKKFGTSRQSPGRW